MTLVAADIKALERIIDDQDCDGELKCYDSNFEPTCMADDFGVRSLLECREKNPEKCKSAILFGNTYLCKCPVRIHIKRTSGK